eukprot:scaffold6277_cov54-Cyclotella_meneghiniana.AAC.1
MRQELAGCRLSKAVESSVDLWMWRVRGGLPATEVWIWSGGWGRSCPLPSCSCKLQSSRDPAEVGVTGLLWLLISYGYVLYMASNLISEGSDLLLLVPSLAGLVGGLVLPLLGAVPDGAIMLFSGLGDIEKAQETLSVGVGALAGSTIMLLTVPWALSVYYGRVDFSGDDLAPNYKKQPKLTHEGACAGLSYTGVAMGKEVNHGSKMMMVTTLPYFLIQVPAFFLTGDRQTVSNGEKNWALAGFITCVIFFVYYMHHQLKTSNEGADKLKRIALTKEAMKKGALSLSGALGTNVSLLEHQHPNTPSKDNGFSPIQQDQNSDEPSPEVKKYLEDVLGDVYKSYDNDSNQQLNLKEFTTFLSDFHENIQPDQVGEVFAAYDKDSSGWIDYDEFIAACYTIIKQANAGEHNKRRSYFRQGSDMCTAQIGSEILSGNDDEDEQEDIPEEFTDLSPDEQQ